VINVRVIVCRLISVRLDSGVRGYDPVTLLRRIHFKQRCLIDLLPFRLAIFAHGV
jgi:hypothetical protein